MTQYRGGHLASCYAQALFNVSDNVDSICKSVKFVMNLFEISDDVFLFLSNPTVLREHKIDIVKVIEGCVDPILVRFMLVIIENNRGNMLLQIFCTFLDLVKKHNREVDICVTSCALLTKQEKESICNVLFEKYGKVVSITNDIDPGILGGFIIRVNFDVIDISLNSYLQSLRELSKMAIRNIK